MRGSVKADMAHVGKAVGSERRSGFFRIRQPSPFQCPVRFWYRRSL